MDESKPGRWRWRIGLRGLLGLVLVLGLAFAWLFRDDRNAFEKLRGEWSRSEHAYFAARDRARTPEEVRKVSAEDRPKPIDFAGRCLELALARPDTPEELAALCWAVGNAPNSEPGRKALALLEGGRLDRVPPADLRTALEASRSTSEVRPNPLVPLVLKVARRDLDQPGAAAILAWVCANQFGDGSAEGPPSFAEAADLIADRFADSPDISHFGETLGTGGGDSPPWAAKYERHLRAILAKNRTRLVRCTASFALASVVEGMGESRQDEAEALYRKFLEDFDGSDPSIKPVEDVLIARAKGEAEGLRKRGVGKPAPATAGEDLEGRPIALGDFRGKVVMVSFWATWCGPCMSLIPHERALLERFQGRPFAIVGVNGDRDPEPLRKALKTLEIPWRSFRDERPGKDLISAEWKVSGWPTLYLIDHEGIIRHRWVGAPGGDTLEREIDRLVEDAARAK